MNVFDIISLLVLLWAVFSGWRSGFVSQVLSFAGLIAGVVLAVRFGNMVGAAMGLESQFAMPVGFVTVFIVTVMVASLVARLVRKLFSAAGLGSVDVLLGILLSVVKFGLILGVVFDTFNTLNGHMKLIDAKYMTHSYTFTPLVAVWNTLLEWFNQYFATYAQ